MDILCASEWNFLILALPLIFHIPEKIFQAKRKYINLITLSILLYNDTDIIRWHFFERKTMSKSREESVVVIKSIYLPT